MSLTTGPFLMWVFLTLIGTEILKVILRFSGATEDAWFMPSTCSAVMTAVTYLSYWDYGFDRIEFTLTVAFAAFLCYDAVRLRRVSSEHAAMINRLARKLKQLDPECDLSTDGVEAEGSSPVQILMGILVGILLCLLLANVTTFQFTSF